MIENGEIVDKEIINKSIDSNIKSNIIISPIIEQIPKLSNKKYFCENIDSD